MLLIEKNFFSCAKDLPESITLEKICMLIPTYINNKRKLSTDNNANIQKRKQALERIYKKDINLSEKIDTIFAFCNYTRTAPIIQAVKHLYDNHTIKRIVFINTHATTNKTHNNNLTGVLKKEYVFSKRCIYNRI